MKTHFLSLILFAMILASSCSQEEIVQQQTVSLSDCKFVASFEQTESRTYLEDGKYLRWTANDELSVFMGKTLNRQFRFTGETGDNSGGFEEASSPGFVTGNDLDNPCHYAIYPYAKGTKITETGVLTVNLPSEQTYEENSFGCGANTMVAVTSSLSDMELSFKNACGYLKFKLYGDDVTVKSVTLQSNGEEKLSGSATLIAANDKNPSITMSSTASDMITLDCGTGVKIGSTSETATEFWIVVPPTTFENGFTVTIKDVNGYEFIKSTSKKISIERNVIKPISAFEVERIPNNQIWYTSSNGDIVIPNDATVFGANIISNLYEDGKGILTFDDDVISIGSDAFRYCDLTSITIPESVVEIGDGAFYECKLYNVKIPDRVASIGMFAFSGCRLKSVVIPKSVNYIGGSTPFSGCNLLSSIIVEQGNQTYDSREYCNAIIETASNTLISGCKGTIIPNSVTNIGINAFRNIASLPNIVIPNNVISIEELAFCNCSSLESIMIPKSVLYIGQNAFTGCSALESIIVENGNSVYDSRENCNAIIEKESNILIQGCKNTVIPNTVTRIEHFAFSGCSSLKCIVIPESVTSIGREAFSECNYLTSIVTSNGLMHIEDFAFYYCVSLSNITIPETVINVGNGAFWGCKSLSIINVKATAVPTIGIDAFAKCNNIMKFYVPAESIDAYKAADYWKDLNILPDNQ